MSLTLITAPASEPVTLEEAKAQCRVDTADDDTLISAYITTARQYVEETLAHCALLTQTWELRRDRWPSSPFRLPLPPLQSISSIKYMDEAGEEYPLDASVYGFDSHSEPGRLFLKPNQSWPSTALYPYGGVRIQFVAGWENTANIPTGLIMAIKLLVGYLYENREQVVVSSGLNVVNLPLGIYELAASSRRMWKF
jgi:uncharacterized phiE125 gp8 family phage protein